MDRSKHTLCLGPCLIAILAATPSAPVRAVESITIRVPTDAPTDVCAIIGVPMYAGPRRDALPAIAALPSGRTSPAQFIPALDSAGGTEAQSGTIYLPLTVRDEERGKTLTFTLRAADEATPPSVRIREVPGQATQFLDGRRLVLQYNHGPKDLNGEENPNAVLGFVHPIYGLDGELFSQNSPPDHRHHRGLFWAWTRLKRDGRTLGSWWDRQDIRYHVNRILFRDAGPVLATVTVEGFWDYQTREMSKPERLVREVATIRVFDDGLTAGANYQAIDVDLDLYAAVDGLTMAGTDVRNKGYGGLTLRLPAPKNGVRITADGRYIPKDANMYRAFWADYSGDFPGATGGQSGVAILTHPSHPGSPPPWCLRYYGPMNPSYPGLEFVPLHKDKPLRLRYRLILHRGTAEQARIGDIYRLYATDWITGSAPHPGVSSQP